MKTEGEVRSRLAEGWHLYYNAGQGRWYIGKGRENRDLVEKDLNEICQEIHGSLPKNEVSVGAIQEKRCQGETIGEIAKETDLSERAVFNAMERDPCDVVKPREGRAAAAPEDGIVPGPSEEDREALPTEEGVMGTSMGTPEREYAWWEYIPAAAVIGGGAIGIGYLILKPVIEECLKPPATAKEAQPPQPAAQARVDVRPEERAPPRAMSRGRYTVVG